MHASSNSHLFPCDHLWKSCCSGSNQLPANSLIPALPVAMHAKPKQACVNCHFFVKEARGLRNGPVTLEVTETDRELCRAGDYSWHKDHYAIACHFAVWDEGHNFDMSRRHEVVVETDRQNFCFFWKHRPGMLLPAARVLQEREAQARDASRDRRLTIVGLFIAAIALLVDVLLRTAQNLHLWPFR